MTDTHPSPHPPVTRPPRAGRLEAIDAARGVALIGMMMINLGTVRSDGWFNKLWTLPFGRASILFVLLAGLGMTLFFGSRREHTRRWPVLIWRALIFLVGGLALQILTPAVSVILPTYGLLFLGALWWRRFSDRALAAVTVLMLIVGPVVVQGHQIPGEHKTRMPTLGESPSTVIHSLFLSGAYPLLVWVVPFLAGMWLGRHDLRDRHVQKRLMLTGATAAALGFVASQVSTLLLGSEADYGWHRLLTGAAHGQMPLWLVSSIGSAAFVIGATLWFWPTIRRWVLPLAYAGQLAFTLYVTHFFVIAAMGGRIESRVVGVPVTVALVLAFTAAATLWVRRWGVGPLERVLRASWLTKISRGTS
ncbi:putative membrane protein [Janibacter sp. HTCC2649]|uniref:DUF418 domain-containing protein n=1 Tax=Janibacter sp. HTCC2649 TaxID=313589 RepID=UPI000066EB87|nr:DUF418 domain-containing protein [Janibacter sp. HTCC2649]EAP98726.1 putative membrane protein [Janibacter sp. HTCC2649]